MTKGLDFIEQYLPDTPVRALAAVLAEFQKQNPDCNFQQMSREIIEFLEEVVEIDGIVTKGERMAIEEIQEAFHEVGELLLKKKAKQGYHGLKKTANTLLSSTAELVPEKYR